jgi:hypothetical protein
VPSDPSTLGVPIAAAASRAVIPKANNEKMAALTLYPIDPSPRVCGDDMGEGTKATHVPPQPQWNSTHSAHAKSAYVHVSARTHEYVRSARFARFQSTSERRDGRAQTRSGDANSAGLLRTLDGFRPAAADRSREAFNETGRLPLDDLVHLQRRAIMAPSRRRAAPRSPRRR